MQFEVYKNNGGGFNWRLKEEDGVVLAVSAAEFATEQAAEESVVAVREHAGMAAPAR